MSYTVVGLFPTNEMANSASNRLDDAGFSKEDYRVSSYKSEGDYDRDDYDYDEDEQTTSFWDMLFGDNDYEKKAYSYAGTKSNVVTVYTDDKDRAERAREIMDNAGATSVDDQLSDRFYASNPQYADRRTGYSQGTGFTGTSAHDRREESAVDRDHLSTERRDTELHDGDKIDVVKEDINIGKKEVQDGGIRIRSRVIEKPVEESVRLREERVYVRRNPVDRAVTDADHVFENTTVEMTQSREVPVVDKTARVVEEISLGKDVEEREETISDSVRETEVDIEDNTGRSADGSSFAANRPDNDRLDNDRRDNNRI